jgi:hypothetical protein
LSASYVYPEHRAYALDGSLLQGAVLFNLTGGGWDVAEETLGGRIRVFLPHPAPTDLFQASMYNTTLPNSLASDSSPSIFVLAAINFYTWFLGILLCFFDWGGDSTLIRRFFFWTDWAAYLFWTTYASCCQQHRENSSHHDHYACVFRVFFPPYLVLISAYLTKYFLVGFPASTEWSNFEFLLFQDSFIP